MNDWSVYVNACLGLHIKSHCVSFLSLFRHSHRSFSVYPYLTLYRSQHLPTHPHLATRLKTRVELYRFSPPRPSRTVQVTNRLYPPEVETSLLINTTFLAAGYGFLPNGCPLRLSGSEPVTARMRPLDSTEGVSVTR